MSNCVIDDQEAQSCHSERFPYRTQANQLMSDKSRSRNNGLCTWILRGGSPSFLSIHLLVNTDAPFVPGTACTTTSCMHLDHLNGGCLVNIPLSPIDLGRSISA
jgi:hypothetical protein